MGVGSYRPDVDGLRGIAILLVVGFHYFPETVRGGYIGVDSFFVISGYFITGIIRDGISAGHFSFTDFYARRIKRLFPALLLILIFSYMVAWAATAADEFQEIGKHIFSGSFFFANFTMANEVGYFAKAADFKPLLTLWSLSVEEQFYIIWPVLIVCLIKLRINLKAATGLLLLIFFGVAYLADPSLADKNYYYPHIRFWEILAGCFLAINVEENKRLNSGWKKIFSITGFLLFLISLVTIKRPDPVLLLMPIAGTVLLILAGKDTWINRKLLSFPPLVTVGLFSYCIYIWHWPLLALVRIAFDYEPDVIGKLGLIVLTFLVSYPSYYFLETPIRRSTSNFVPLALLAGVSFVGILGYVTYATELIPPRSRIRNAEGRLALFDKKLQEDSFYPNKLLFERRRTIRRGICHYPPESGSFKSHLPNLRKCLNIESLFPKIAIIGDSHAADLYGSLSRSHPQINFLQMTGAGCTFNNMIPPECGKMIEFAVSFSETSKIDAVILASGWNNTFPVIEEIIERLQKANRKVIIAGPPPYYKKHIRLVLEKRWGDEDLQSIVRRNLRTEQFDLNNKMKHYARIAGAAYIDRLSLTCKSSEYCEVLSETGELLVMDTIHITVPGMDYLGKRILEEKVLETILDK